MTLLQVSVLFAGLFGILAAGPAPAPTATASPVSYHPFCKVVWLFATPCVEVTTKIIEEILALSPLKGCKDCNYTLVSVDSTVIKANHTSLANPVGENITLTIVPSAVTGSCRISALSVSVTFRSLLDGGQNYCNLYKLLSASGLSSEPGFVEVTNEWACLSYAMATCNK